MQDIEDVDSLTSQVDDLADDLRRGHLDGRQVEEDLICLVEYAMGPGAGTPAETAGFVDHVLAVTLELSVDPRLGRATLHETVRNHLDRLVRRGAASERLDDRLAGIRLGLSFDCDTEHLELVQLCREGRAEDSLLHVDAGRACDVVRLAEEFEVIRALEATVTGGEDSWQRLGQHHAAWTVAFDALAAIAWNPRNARAEQARGTLLDLLAHPHTALDAAVRIQPAWLGGSGLHQALAALDRIESWIEAQPATDPVQDRGFGAIRHAVTSLVWLAQDAQRSTEAHALWGRQ